MPGWLNHDIDIDIRKPLPFPNDSVRFVLAEHVVEHITPGEAWGFFQELRRVLKAGGVARIVVPCVDLIYQRYDQEYADFLKNKFLNKKVKNNGSLEEAMQSIICHWGHRAVWTTDAMEAVLQSFGFETSVAQPKVSRFVELNNVDGHYKSIGEHANWVESGVVEAIKGSASPQLEPKNIGGRVLGLFDRAYVVNRDQDVMRMERTKGRLEKVGIPFQRFPAICFTDDGGHESAGERGNYCSHLAIVEAAQKEGLSSVLIMEDDVIFRDNFLYLWAQILPKLKLLNYDVFYGYNWWNKKGQAKSIDLAPIKSTVCTHFYAIHSRFYKKFIEITIANQKERRIRAIDGVFTTENAALFAPTYNLVGQDEGISLVKEGFAKKLRWSA